MNEQSILNQADISGRLYKIYNLWVNEGISHTNIAKAAKISPARLSFLYRRIEKILSKKIERKKKSCSVCGIKLVGANYNEYQSVKRKSPICKECVKKLKPDLWERIFSKVKLGRVIRPYVTTPCFEWQGAISGGRAMVAYKKDNEKVARAHYAYRVVYELVNKTRIPDGLMICHHCDNGACVNPSHLFLGSAIDNFKDMVSKGRGYVFVKGGPGRGHKK